MIRDFLKIFPERQQEYADLLTANPIWMARTKGVGIISPEAAITYSLTGACLRGSGVNYDIRKAMPYCVYDRLDFEVPLGQHGDIYDRYLVRMEEMRQTIKIIGQASTSASAMDTPADGLRVGLRHPAAQGHDDDRRGHAAPLHLGDQGLQPAGRRGLRRGRAPQGRARLLHRLRRHAAAYRFRIRTPDFVNLGVLPHMAQGAMLADVVALIGTIDIVLGSVDR